MCHGFDILDDNKCNPPLVYLLVQVKQPITKPMNYAKKKKPTSRPLVIDKKRTIKRIDVRPHEGIDAAIRLDHFNEPIDVRVYDFSLQGLCIVVPKEIRDHINLVQDYQIELQFVLNSSPKKTKASGIYKCCWIEDFNNNQFRIGFRSTNSTRIEGYKPKEAQSNLVEIPKSFPILGFYYKDHFYYERAALRLISINRNEVNVEVFDSELLLLPGMKIEIMFAIQAAKGPRINGIVTEITPKDAEHTIVNVEILDLPESLERDLVNHLLQNTDLTPEKIRQARFKVKNIANTFRFRYLRDQEEYEQVLKLRFAAYKAAGKTKDSMTYKDLAAPLDNISRILLAYHGDKLVASVAMSFPESESEILDTERALPGGYPKEFPPKTKVIEVARLCTDPSYRRGDLALRMFEHLYRVFALSQREFIITSTDNNLWILYKKLGFRKSGYNYLHPYLAGIEHHIIIVHRSTGTAAKKINPLNWGYFYYFVNGYLKARGKKDINLFYILKKLTFKVFKLIFKNQFKRDY